MNILTLKNILKGELHFESEKKKNYAQTGVKKCTWQQSVIYFFLSMPLSTTWGSAVMTQPVLELMSAIYK